MQAARSSDFAIGQFKFLKPLLFIHGRESYRRNSLLINYTIYKNILYVFVQYLFGFVSLFSGQTLYDPLIYQLYNVSFTGIPIMFYCLFDFEFSKKDLMANPKHFRLGLEDKSFTTLRFWSWCLYAGYHSVIILVFVFICSEQSLMEDGKNYNFWAGGHNVYLACILTVSFVLFRNIHNHNGW